ncbi:MAG TPA: hypothetical protein VH044_12800 [Polyangiaceae bacterium]|nr:hypothetical protein [Polyangiaceae bacterium]
MPRRTIAAALGVISVLCALPAAALAQAPPAAQRAQIYSTYEQQTIDAALTRRKEKLDPHPEGKIIESVEIIPLDVIEQRDPLPNFLNVFHTTTRASVVRRELLLREGEPYQQVLVDETLRNLRQLIQLSLVLVVPTVGSAPDRIGLIVITKDVWSLRANWNLVVTPGGLEELDLEPDERNLFGRHQIVRANFILEPATYTLGLGYSMARIDTSRIALVTSANVIVNRDTGSLEGSYGSLVAGQPLYSALAKWAWDATTSWEDAEIRRYVNAHTSTFVDPATGDSVPYEYRARQFISRFELRRSFGWDVKHDFTLAAGISHEVYRTNFPGADPRTVADFEAAAVPVSDTRVGPSLQYETYTKRYLRVLDFDTLALQEDYRLGHDIVLSVAPSFHALGSTLDIVSLGAAAQYTFALRDGLFRVGVTTLTEPTADRVAQALVEPYAHLVTPTIAGLGRIVVTGTMEYRWRDYLNITDTLGGSDRLRGYPTNFFVGQDWIAYNVELRTRPVEILSCQLAAVGFFDAGDAFNGWSNLRPFQSVGVGLRGLFPQLDRGVLRADLGFPIERVINPSTGAPIPPMAFLVTFGQAFSAPSDSPVPVLPTEQVEEPEAAP